MANATNPINSGIPLPLGRSPQISLDGNSTTPAIQFNQEEQAFHRHLTLGIEEKLQKNRMIKDIKMIIRKPVEKSSLSGWERKHGVNLPTDLKDYYFSTNGFKLTWSLEHAGDVLKIGEMNINEIKQLVVLDSTNVGEPNAITVGNNTKSFDPRKSQKPLTGNNLSSFLNDGKSARKNLSGMGVSNDVNFEMYYTELRHTMEANGQVKSQDPGGLVLLPNDKAFILDPNRYGWICLIYPEASNKVDTSSSNTPSPRSPVRSALAPVPAPEPSIEIWFMDPSFQWHYLAPTFTHYYRMLLFHLGLPQWQYRFTQYGLSSWAEQMFWLVAPHLLTPPRISKFPSIYHAGGLWSTDVPVEASAPNPTPNVLTNQIFRRKKKDKSEIK